MVVKDIIGFGAINLDLFYQVSNFTQLNNQISEEGFTPFLYDGENQGKAEDLTPLVEFLKQETQFSGYSGGGSAANAAVAAAKLGLDAGVIGKIGNRLIKQMPEINSTFLVESLQGIDTKKIIIKDGMSGVCISLIDEAGERSLQIFPNINDTLSYEEIDLTYIKNCRILHLSSFTGELPFQAQVRIVQQLPESIKISLDPGAIYAQKRLSVLEPIIKHAYIIFATKDEIELITEKSYEQGCKILLTLGPKIVALKLGKEGSLIFRDEEVIQIKAHPAISSDATGAGDVYAAAFLSSLLEEKSLTECGTMASKASALSLSGLGRKHYPTKEQILSH